MEAESLRVSEGPTALIWEVDLFKALAKAFEYQADFEKAYRYGQQYQEAYEKLHNARIVSDFFIKEIGSRLERERLQANLEKELLEKRIDNQRQGSYILVLLTVLAAVIGAFFVIQGKDQPQTRKPTCPDQ